LICAATFEIILLGHHYRGPTKLEYNLAGSAEGESVGKGFRFLRKLVAAIGQL
jgi:hypothetical protein